MSHHLAYTTKGDGRAPIAITEADRSRHVFAIGQTGVGKSTFIRNLIMQDITEGRGFSFFDPHGADAEDILDYIPSHRIEETIYFNPQDTEHPIGFNLLGGGGEDDLIVASVIESLRQAWPNSWGARMEHILRNCFYALLSEPGTTILHVQRLLTDKAYRRSVTRKITNIPVKHFWDNEFAGYDHRFRVQAIAPIQNKIGYITSNALLRNILGQTRSRFSIPDIFDNQKIFIANLSGIGAKESDFLGSLLLTAYHMSAMRRRGSQPAHHVYLDEVHRFSTPTLASMLSEIRKKKVSITMAQQFLDQNKDEMVRKALLGNVGTLAVFRVAPADADVLSMALDTEIVSSSELTGLSVGEIYVRTSIEGNQLTQRAHIKPDAYMRKAGRKQSIINDSQRAWGTRREKIEKRIDRIFNAV